MPCNRLKPIAIENALFITRKFGLANLSRTGLVDFGSSGADGTWKEMGSIRYSLSPLGRRFLEIFKVQAQ
jgi:hypothetical protein